MLQSFALPLRRDQVVVALHVIDQLKEYSAILTVDGSVML